MNNTVIIGCRPRRTREAAGWRAFITNAVGCAAILLGGAGNVIAGKTDSTATANSALTYQPYDEVEIKAALQHPLTLEGCIRTALSRNIALRVAQGDLAKAEAGVSRSYGKFLPVFTLEGSKQQTKEDRPIDPEEPDSPTAFDFDNKGFVGTIGQTLITGATLNFAVDLRRDINSPDRFGDPPTRTENRDYTATFTQPLLRDAWFKMARSEYSLAQHERHMQQASLDDSKLQTIFATKRAFYRVLLQRELIKVHQVAVQKDSTLVLLSESKVKAMLATRRDVLSAEIRLAEDRAAFITSETEYQRSLDVLKDIMGLPIEMPVEVAGAELSYSTDPLNEKVLIQRALKDSPLIRRAEFSVKSSRLQHSVARNQLLPRLDLSVQYNGRLDSDTDQNRTVNSKDWEATVSLRYPFLDRAASADAEKARVLVSQDEDRLADLQRQIVLSLRDIVRSAYSSVEELSAIRRSIEAAEQKVDFATTMFNLGRASNFDITDAQEALLKAQTSYLRKLVEYNEQLALLESLTGQPLTQ